MLAFQWNALRTGARVVVHDDVEPGFPLREGVVKLVQTRRGAVNDVGIQLSGDDAGVARPRRHAVHMQPVDRRFTCWRCDAMGAPGQRDFPLSA